MFDTVPELSGRYSRRSFFLFGAVFFILGYGGVGMTSGFIPVAADQRVQQIWIGLAFLVLAAGFGIALYRMIRTGRQPVLTLDTAGIWDKRVTNAPVPFSAIEGLDTREPGFIEFLVMPGGRKGTLVLRIRKNDWDRLEFTGSLARWLQVALAGGPRRLRVFHKTLDIPYQPLKEALQQALGPST